MKHDAKGTTSEAEKQIFLLRKLYHSTGHFELSSFPDTVADIRALLRSSFGLPVSYKLYSYIVYSGLCFKLCISCEYSCIEKHM